MGLLMIPIIEEDSLSVLSGKGNTDIIREMGFGPSSHGDSTNRKGTSRGSKKIIKRKDKVRGRSKKCGTTEEGRQVYYSGACARVPKRTVGSLPKHHCRYEDVGSNLEEHQRQWQMTANARACLAFSRK
ncbi:hypothetical protein HZH68_012312 [Vespula germanica]|uniref:Uncharacterized protein n=1 Tax=Vespula germanica TaxID=30212 RepID=A0A834MXQ6_VESGE|nr:hypothetical protein HZH68_012312 [Vespula germanica]